MIFLVLALLALPITWLVGLVIVSFSAKVSRMESDGLFLTYCAVLAIISIPCKRKNIS